MRQRKLLVLSFGLLIASAALAHASQRAEGQPTPTDLQRVDKLSLQVGSDVAVRYAEAAAKVARFTWQRYIEATKRVPSAIADAELKRLELEYRKAELEVEKAKIEWRIAKVQEEINAAKRETAQLIKGLKGR